SQQGGQDPRQRPERLAQTLPCPTTSGSCNALSSSDEAGSRNRPTSHPKVAYLELMTDSRLRPSLKLWKRVMPPLSAPESLSHHRPRRNRGRRRCGPGGPLVIIADASVLPLKAFVEKATGLRSTGLGTSAGIRNGIAVTQNASREDVVRTPSK